MKSEIATSFADFELCDPTTWTFPHRRPTPSTGLAQAKGLSEDQPKKSTHTGTFGRLPCTIMPLDTLDLQFVTTLLYKGKDPEDPLTQGLAHELVYTRMLIHHSDYGCPSCSSDEIEFYPGDNSTKGWYCLRCTNCKTYSEFFCVLNAHQLRLNWTMDYTCLPKVPYALIPPMGVIVAFGQVVAKKTMDAMNGVLKRPKLIVAPAETATTEAKDKSKDVTEPDEAKTETDAEKTLEEIAQATGEELDDALIILNQEETVNAFSKGHRSISEVGYALWQCPECDKKEVTLAKRKNTSAVNDWNMYEYALHCVACKHTSQFESSIYQIGYKLSDSCKWAKTKLAKQENKPTTQFDDMGHYCGCGYD